MVFVKTGNQNLILKSGTDFRQFSYNKLKIYKNGEKNNLEQEIDSSGKYLTKRSSHKSTKSSNILLYTF